MLLVDRRCGGAVEENALLQSQSVGVGAKKECGARLALIIHFSTRRIGQ